MLSKPLLYFLWERRPLFLAHIFYTEESPFWIQKTPLYTAWLKWLLILGSFLNFKNKWSQVWRHMPVFPALGRLRQEKQVLKTSLVYTARSKPAWIIQWVLVSNKQTKVQRNLNTFLKHKVISDNYKLNIKEALKILCKTIKDKTLLKKKKTLF